MKDYTPFIEKHVVAELMKQGYEQSVALKGAEQGGRPLPPQCFSQRQGQDV
ncbi:hypothetical protein SODG_004197 [Sodalis praecaptivus]